MKRSLFMFAIIVFCNSIVCSQELTKQMFNIYYGQPKKLVQSSNQSSQSMIIEFDRSGRVLSKSSGNGKMIYNWNSDGSTVEVKAYDNGQYVGTGMIEVELMSPDRYKYTADGALIEVSFRTNGSINKMKMSGGGQSLSTTYYYNNSSDIYPYKIVSAGGGQSMTVNVSVDDKDSKGNCIRCVQSISGQSMITTNIITYY